MVTVPFSRSRVTPIPSKHYDTFSEQQGIVDIEGGNDDQHVLRVDVDARVRLDAFEADLYQVFVNQKLHHHLSFCRRTLRSGVPF